MDIIQQRKKSRREHILTRIVQTVVVFGTFFLFSYGFAMTFLLPGTVEASSDIFVGNTSLTYIALSTLGKVNIDINPATNEGMATSTDLVGVSTNTSTHYLYVSTTSEEEGSNRLCQMDADDLCINPLLIPSENLDAGRWGVQNISTGIFYGIPYLGDELIINSAETPLSRFSRARETYTEYEVTYGVKVDYNTVAGTYYGAVQYSVAAGTDIGVATVSPSKIQYAETGTTRITVKTPLLTNMDYGDWTVTIHDGDGVDCTNAEPFTNEEGTMSVSCDAPNNLEVDKEFNVSTTSVTFGTFMAINGIHYVDSLPFFEITEMSDLTPPICTGATTPNPNATRVDTTGEHNSDPNYVPQIELRDSRDGKYYVVRKLADGNCWMAQNLDLDIYISTRVDENNNSVQTFGYHDTNGTFRPFTSEDTNLTVNEYWDLSTGSSGYNTQTSLGVAWSANGVGDTTVNTDSYEIRSYDPGMVCSNEDGYPDATCTEPLGSANTRHHGNYYNWPAATAGSGVTSLGHESHVANSICPAGWHLPYGGENNTELGTLKYITDVIGEIPSNALGSKILRSSPYDYVFSGRYNPKDGQIILPDHGVYWTGTQQGPQHAYYSTINLNTQTPGVSFYSPQGSGLTVRCISDQNRDTWMYSLMFDANGGSGGMATQNGFTPVGQTREFTIDDNNPSRIGHSFVGWSESPDATEADPRYAIGQTLTLTQQDFHKKLYAVWDESMVNMGNMQDLTTEMCDSMHTGARYYMTDTRNGKQYAIRKHVDGKCWMAQNLDLDIQVKNGYAGTAKNNKFVKFTSDNTDLNSKSDWTASTGSTIYTTQTTTGEKWTDPDTSKNAAAYNAYSYDPGDQCQNIVDESTNQSVPIPCVVQVAGTTVNSEHDGNYYNWPTATAGSGNNTYVQDQIAPDSICPKGWHIPYGNNKTTEKGGDTPGGTHYLVLTKRGIVGAFQENYLVLNSLPFSYNPAGYYSATTGSIVYYGERGYYVTSTSSGLNGAYTLMFNETGDVAGLWGDYQQQGSNKWGQSIRCVSN